MWNSAAPRALALWLALLPAAAAAEAPLSAIDWLSESVRQPAPPPDPAAPDIARSAAAGDVTSAALGAVRKDAVGLLPGSVTGFPPELWSGSATATLVSLLALQRSDALPAVLDLLYKLLLAEVDPPADADASAGLFLARIDKLLDLGALDQAQALVERAGPNEPEIFRRWFDISLLTGHEDRACAAMRATPDIAPTLPARIFCLARGGDWNAAVLTLATARTLGQIAEPEAELLAWFLDPELFEGDPEPALPARLTPLVFRMREAVALPRPPAPLPLAFANVDLSSNAPWRSRLEAAERLARTQAVEPGVLFSLYTERRPAASGGIWDRVEAVQALDVAVLAGDPAAVAATLPRAWDAMRAVGLETAFARRYADPLARLALPETVSALSFRVALLSPRYESAALARRPADAGEARLRAIATGTSPADAAAQPLAVALRAGSGRQEALLAAIAAAFSDPLGPGVLLSLLEEGKLGEAILRAMLRIEDGAHADPNDIQNALALLRRVGLEDEARRIALQLLLLDRRG